MPIVLLNHFVDIHDLKNHLLATYIMMVSEWKHVLLNHAVSSSEIADLHCVKYHTEQIGSKY